MKSFCQYSEQMLQLEQDDACNSAETVVSNNKFPCLVYVTLITTYKRYRVKYFDVHSGKITGTAQNFMATGRGKFLIFFVQTLPS
jgi:hypothetical protein